MTLLQTQFLTVQMYPSISGRNIAILSTEIKLNFRMLSLQQHKFRVSVNSVNIELETAASIELSYSGQSSRNNWDLAIGTEVKIPRCCNEEGQFVKQHSVHQENYIPLSFLGFGGESPSVRTDTWVPLQVMVFPFKDPILHPNMSSAALMSSLYTGLLGIRL